MQSLIPPEFDQPFYSGLLTIVLAWMGRMMWHVREVQGHRRRFFSMHLIWELMTAICIGFLADGVAEWVGLVGKPATAAIIFVSYLGPRGVEQILLAYADKFTTRKGK